MKREHAIYLLWGDNFENRDSMMKQSHALWYAAPSKIPADYDYTRTRKQTAAYSSWVHIYPPCMQFPQWARSFCSCLNTIYIPSVFFKHSPKPPFPPQCHIISRSTRWDAKLSSIILTSLWVRSCPMGVEVEKAFGGGEDSGGEHAAWMHERCTFAPLPPLSYSVSHIKLMAKLL